MDAVVAAGADLADAVHSPGMTGPSLVQELQRAITQSLAVRAESPTYVQFEREAARTRVKEFVKKGVVSQDQWKLQSGLPIRVYFACEPIQSLSS